MRRALLIVNPAAGGGRAARLLPAVEQALRGHGIEFATERTRDLEDARRLGRNAAEAGETAIALGGDGLAGAVAGAMAGINGAVLGVLPGGRGNDLVRTLGIPADAVAACAVIAGDATRPLDLGMVDGRHYIGVASAGFDSDANRIANEAPAFLGNLVYAYGALRALITWQPARFSLELDGRRHEFSGYSFAAANSKAYGGGMYIAPNAELDDGLLDVVISEHASRRRFLANLPKVFKGKHINEPTVHVLRGRELHVSADRPFTVYADGDPIGELPAVISAVPRALHVLAPA